MIESWAGETESLSEVQEEMNAMILSKRRSKASSSSRKRKLAKDGDLENAN